MFSGIVEEIGKVLSTSDSGGGCRLKIGALVVCQDLKLGDSVAVNGACMTVCQFDKSWFVFEATHESLRRTDLGNLKIGDPVNLERALRFSDRLGGHLVSGHVDALARVQSIREEGFSRIIEFGLDRKLAPYFVEKGSVTVDGVSLTVAFVKDEPNKAGFVFAVALIPHTLSVTTMGQLKIGDLVNIEADLVGKYVARWMEQALPGNLNKNRLTEAFLSEHGYT